MKKTLILMCCALTLLGLTACGTNDAVSTIESASSSESVASVSPSVPALSGTLEADESKVTEMANALLAGGWLSSSYMEFEVKNNLALTTFFCMMNPGYAYPDKIPASVYEPFIQGSLDISTEFLHGIEDYDAESDTYAISADISLDMLNAQIRDYFKIDSIREENGLIKVSYRILFGEMAGSGDGSDSVFEGYILLKETGNYYHVDLITLTENNAKKYDG